VTKLSFHAFGFCVDKYQLLNSGAALGKGVGPLLVAKRQAQVNLAEATVAIPGRYTTANFLLGLIFPEVKKRDAILFSEIEDAILEGVVDAGLLIHENRFTYAERGLTKLADLGEEWQKMTGRLIPLGGIAVRRDLELALRQKIDRVLRRRVDFAWAHPREPLYFVRSHAQEMEDDVLKKHIQLYVNRYTRSLSKMAREAIEAMMALGRERGVLPEGREDFFLEK